MIIIFAVLGVTRVDCEELSTITFLPKLLLRTTIMHKTNDHENTK